MSRVSEALARCTDAQGQLQQTFSYWEVDEGSSNQHSKGKLQTATRYNQVALGGGITVPVVERYRYNGTAGQVSERLTEVSGASELRRWREGYVYDFLGNVTSLQYPCLATAQWGCTESAPALVHSYGKGYLTGISGWLPSIGYHDNGMLAQVRYQHLGAGVTDRPYRATSGSA